jgi:hypothetical protein
MRSASIVSPANISRAFINAPEVAMNACGIATHSACHGPVARSKSCAMASSINAHCWRTTLAAATISSEEIGLRFCGMVLLEPRPCWNGSKASANSVAISNIMSVPTLASDPVTSPVSITASARPSRDTCQVTSASPSCSSRIIAARTRRPSAPSEASVPAAPPNWPTSTRGRSCRRRSRWRTSGSRQIATL